MGISQYGWAGPKGSTLNWVLVTSSTAHINCIDNYIIPIHKERFCCQQWCCYHIHGLDVSTNLCSYSSLSEKRDKHIICCRDIGWTIFNQSSIIKSHLSEVLLSFLAPPAAQASSFKSLVMREISATAHALYRPRLLGLQQKGFLPRTATTETLGRQGGISEPEGSDESH